MYRGEERNKKNSSPTFVHAYAARMRGSLQYNSKSASRLPITRNTDDNRTAAITTYTSRARIASSTSGPSPGQLSTTSIKRDMLSSDPIENPSKEISEFIPAGNACRYT